VAGGSAFSAQSSFFNEFCRQTGLIDYNSPAAQAAVQDDGASAGRRDMHIGVLTLHQGIRYCWNRWEHHCSGERPLPESEGSDFCVGEPLRGSRGVNTTGKALEGSRSGIMAAVQQLLEPLRTPARPQSINGTAHTLGVGMGLPSLPATSDITLGSSPQGGDTRTVIILYGHGQDKIVAVFAEVLGKIHRLGGGFKDVTLEDKNLVVGIPAGAANTDISTRDRASVVVINAHCTGLGMPPDVYLSAQCDYEFLYTETPFFRRDLSRFISHTLGQINHHETLMAKPRTYFISTTFPDVRAALPNIDILTVGSDAVEIRVDLLKEPLSDGSFASIPSLSYVGEQVMLLRQRTELPIIFTVPFSGALSILMSSSGSQSPSDENFMSREEAAG
jgi:hypothetical protein